MGERSKGRWITQALLVLLLAVNAQAATIDTLPTNQWYQVPSSHMDTVFFSPSPGGNPINIMDAWGGGSYDTSRDRLIIWGGGHVDYAGNELYTFSASSLTWTRLNDPTATADLDSGDTIASTGLYFDGKPRSRHTYDYILYVPSIDRFCSFGMAGNWFNGQSGSNRVDCFNFTTLTWALQTTAPTSGITAQAVYDSGTGLVWLNGGSNGTLSSWNPLTDTWATRNTTDNFAQSVQVTAAIDSTRHKLAAVGDGVFWTYDLTLGGTITRVNQATTGPQAVVSCSTHNPGFVYVASLDRYVGWCGGSALYSLHPTTFVWSVMTLSGSNTVTPTSPTNAGTYGRFQYIAAHNAFIVVNHTNEDVYIFKLSASVDTIAPSQPTNLAVNVISSSQLNLTWTASVDATGVTGYNIYRCTGAGCTPTVLLTSIGATTSFSNTGLAASTLYRYAVSATDAASNESVKSATAENTTTGGGTLNLGTLVIDGPATPEQISLYLPVTGSLPQTATATVRYKATASPTFIVGHPMYRIQPSLSGTPGTGSVVDAFAWPVIDLQPNTSYDVEVTACDGATCNVKTLTTTTRALPATAGVANKTIAAGSSAATIQTAFNGLVAGDVLQFANGTYNLSARLTINRTGTLANPIYIRGASRAGVTLSATQPIQLTTGAANIVFENMTIAGTGTDSGVDASSIGIGVADQATADNITIRNITMTGIDRAVGPTGFTGALTISGWLVYDNTMAGNDRWTGDFYGQNGAGPPIAPDGIIDINQNLYWNDDGINLPGLGNVAFNNTLSGFGDSMAYTSGGSNPANATIGVHYYRNRILSGGDDGTEIDHAQRNVTFYDNYLENTMTFISLDPVYAGPILIARNIAINQGRQPYKFNSGNSGYFIYNNTVTHTTTRLLVTDPCAEAGWYQANNGAQQSYAYRNNILVYRGGPSPCGSQTTRLDNTGHTTLDWTNNSWFPNAIFAAFGGTYANLAAAQAGVANSTPVFSANIRRMSNDNITVSNPWTQTVTMGSDYQTEVTPIYTMILSAGDAAKNSGAILPNITDGFSGVAPDRGAVIAGRPLLTYGDRSGGALAALVAPTSVAVTTP